MTVAAPPDEPGVLAPRASMLCSSCRELLVQEGRKASEFVASNAVDFPLFCKACATWFHRRCVRSGTWSGERCPSCRKPTMSPVFFCLTCNQAVPVRLESAWPTFPCGTCANPVAFAVLEETGGAEIALLVLVGAVAAAGFVMALVFHLPMAVKVLAAVLALPLALPWLAHALAGMLAGIMPVMMNVKAPAAGGMRTRIVQATEFRSLPLKARLGKVYGFYAARAIPAMIFVVLAIVFIEAVLSSQRHR